MKKSTHRNVYALQGRPFVLASGHRLYARDGSALNHGRKILCAPVNVNPKGMTVKVQVDEGVYEVLGGPYGSEFIESPDVLTPKGRRRRSYRIVHPTMGILRK